VKILFLTHRLPYAPDRGDRIRAYHMLDYLSQRADVHVLSLVHDRQEGARAQSGAIPARRVTIVQRTRVRNAARSVLALPTARPLTHTLLDGRQLGCAMREAVALGPDLILAYCSGMARLALEGAAARLPLVLDMVDVDSAKWRDMAAGSTGPRRWIYAREADRLARFEAAAAGRAAATLVVNAREREALRAVAPRARVHVIENGVALDAFRERSLTARQDEVVFCGVMNYRPNLEAAVWLAEHVWPLVRASRPNAKLTLVGARPPRRVRALAEADASIEVTGTVPDVRPYLWRAAVAAAPLSIARGVQNKVLEALAAGLPAVVTPEVRDGLPAEALRGCTVASSVRDFAAALLSVLARSDTERRDLAARADLSALTWERRLGALPGILSEATQTRS
jgi:sugar transferase (PEP-CTERM/EpsH1 system associated)